MRYSETFKIFLCENPDFGKLIKGSGGIRKIRWRTSGKGKSGGVRVLYYWMMKHNKIILLDIYSKTDKENLTDSEIKSLAKIVAEFKR